MKNTTRRQARLNSLLREVITEVIQRELKNPSFKALVSVTNVEITADLKFAKVFISVIGSDKERDDTLALLQHSAGFIGSHSSKKVRMRFFPTLTFYIDKSVDEHMKIEKILQDLEEKRKKNPPKFDEETTN